MFGDVVTCWVADGSVAGPESNSGKTLIRFHPLSLKVVLARSGVVSSFLASGG